MLLISATVHQFMSINTAQKVQIEPAVTVLVGMNEAGKTVFLRALEKSNDALNLAKFAPISDYPRKDYTSYQRKHKDSPAAVTELTYQLTDSEVDELNASLHTQLPHGLTFTETHNYANGSTIFLSVNEKPAVAAVGASFPWSSDALSAVMQAKGIRDIPAALKNKNLTETDKSGSVSTLREFGARSVARRKGRRY